LGFAGCCEEFALPLSHPSELGYAIWSGQRTPDGST